MLKKIVIHNYRLFRDFMLEFTPGMNILVGDNDTGKSTVLEAVNLALTGRVQNRLLAQDLSPYLFNLDITREYIRAVQDGQGPEPPDMIVDLYLEQSGTTAHLKGRNNSTDEDTYGPPTACASGPLTTLTSPLSTRRSLTSQTTSG